MGQWVRAYSQSHVYAKHVMSSYHQHLLKFELVNPLQGQAIRCLFSNVCGDNEMVITGVQLMIADQVVPLTFQQQPAITIAPGETQYADVIDYSLAAGEVLGFIISFGGDSKPTSGNYHRITSMISRTKTDLLGLPTDYRPGLGTPGFAGFDILSDAGAGLLCIGDSMLHVTTWTNKLQEYLLRSGNPGHLSVLNHGISGNQVLEDGQGSIAFYGPSLSHRLHRDGLDVPGIKGVILEGGANDLFLNPDASAADIIAGLIAIINGFTQKQIAVFLMTLPPMDGEVSYQPAMGEMRRKINDWIATQDLSAGVIDLARVLDDPAQANHLYPPYAMADLMHPNEAGSQAIYEAIMKTSSFRKWLDRLNSCEN